MDVGRVGSYVRGAALGAGLVYLFDPAQGSRRRAGMRDKANRAITATDRFLDGAARDLNNRLHGIWCGTRSAFSFRRPSDVVVVERVRARLGRVTSHARAIHVEADCGRVTLTGCILAAEVERVLGALSSVRGVRRVVNQLEPKDDPENTAELQGGGRLLEPISEHYRERWTDGPRLLAILAGGTLAIYGVRRGGLAGLAAGAAGMGLTIRAGANRSLATVLGVQSGRRTIDVQKTINIDAPVEKVYQAFSDYRFFPYFLSNVQEVHDLGNGHSYWTIAAPGGVSLSWEAEITKLWPNRAIAWKTSAGAKVEHAGTIQFRSDAQGGTQVHIRLAYKPPAGLVGHAVASLAGTDPKHLLDADLARMKTFVETGTPAHDAARARRLAA